MTADVVSLPRRVPQWTFAERVRKVRRDMGLTQIEFAEKLEVGAKAYGTWETGRYEPGNLVDVAVRLERITGVPRQWFLGWMDDAPEPSGPEGGESGRRDSNSQHSAWNVDASVVPLRIAA